MIKDLTDAKIFKCPRCEKSISLEGNPYRPFCSKKCKIMDLAAWFREEYQISSPIEPEDELFESEVPKVSKSA
jgi:endogenous inhibitor of DNA gyrase (YacG/DUF329 family)